MVGENRHGYSQVTEKNIAKRVKKEVKEVNSVASIVNRFHRQF